MAGKLVKMMKKKQKELGVKPPTTFISTGSYAFDGILSGKIIDGGIPCGMITSIVGQSSSGKSLLAAMICANAQKQKREVIWHDSENANNEQWMETVGCKWDDVGYDEVYTLDGYRNELVQMLNEAEKEDKPNYLFVLDSLGNLPTEKELKDAEEGHNASDMGLRAKIIKAMSRMVTGKFSKLNIPYLIVNHGYQNISNPNQKRLNPSGGQGVRYISTIMAEMTKTKKRDSEKNLTGNIFKLITTKNRLVPEEQKAEVLISYTDGINPYYGLADNAEKFGFIEKSSAQFYYVKHLDKKIRTTKIYVPEVWEPILKDFDKMYQEKNRFSSIAVGEKEELNPELLEG